MLIRSQDKKSITNCLELKIVAGIIEGEDICTSGGRFLGHYSTEEKAIKVLDMIQNAYVNYQYSKWVGYESETVIDCIFEMPMDDEVKA